ncbi:adhesion G protein-coupled receptor L2-like [Centruroides vittatus]|uniref:adhesion G protein-coupled receptor L2-like n=1 Tax=Centruroides vittatus TaxID=120091 RepID=UPI00350EEFD5
MYTFNLIVLYLSALLSFVIISQSEHAKEEEKLIEARRRCCSPDNPNTFCTQDKCYFLLSREKSWSAARTACRRFYEDLPDLVDSVSFSSQEELETVLESINFTKSKVWTNGICCGENDLEHRWINGDQFKLETDNAVTDEFCSYLTLNIKDKLFLHENETNKYQVLCLLKIPKEKENTSIETTSEVSKTPDVTSSSMTKNTKSITSYHLTSPTITEEVKPTPEEMLYCEGKTFQGIEWPRTGAGKCVTMNCPKETVGKAFWYCDEFGHWKTERPNLNGCISPWIDQINQEINQGKDPTQIAEKLSDLSKQELKLGDLNGVMEIIKNLLTHFEANNSSLQFESYSVVTFSKAIVKTGSNLLDNKQKSGWKSLPEVKRVETAHNFMQKMEKIGRMIACGSILDTEESIVEENLALQNFFLEEDTQIIFPRSRDLMNTSTSIYLPKNLTHYKLPTCTSFRTGFGIIYKNIAPYLSEDQEKWEINSKTIGFNFGDSATSINLPEGMRVEITLEHLYPGNFNTTCVFWNIETLRWDGTNCSIIKSNKTHTKCGCSHLTNFAVLMDISGNIDKDNAVMTYLTYICCSLSIISLIITICCLLGFRAVHSRRTTITCNLCYCLLIVNLIVIFGLERTEVRVICSIIAGLLHYVATASFVWMLLEGYHLYQMVIVVFHKIDTIKFRWLYLFGYGTPLLIVICSAAINPNSYGRDNFCWISYEQGFMWSFAGPVAAIILANTVVLMMALRSASNVKMKTYQTKVKNVLGWLKGSFSLMSLLGITWVFGFVYASETTLDFAYVFIFFNGLQGVFLMIFHVILNEKVRQCFRHIVARRKVSHHIFINSLRTTTSQNPLNSQSIQPSKTSYLSSPRRSSVSPVTTTFTAHI